MADLNQSIIKNLHKIPHNVDLVVGIPRSGMLPANLIALYLNKPFTDINSFIEGRIYNSGERGKIFNVDEIKNIIVIDDSISSGNALNKAKAKLITVKDNYNIRYGVVFATTESKDKVDFYCEIINGNRVFQWNVLNHYISSIGCWDLDGVLCVDPPIDDDGEKYLNYISNATPLFIPTIEIDTIVTCRLEKYRNITEIWLKEHNVKYKNLVMLPFKTKEERVKWGKHGEYKGTEFKNRKEAPIFIESSLHQAQKIANISGKPVFCIETFDLVNSPKDKFKRSVRRFIPENILKIYRKLSYRHKSS